MNQVMKWVLAGGKTEGKAEGDPICVDMDALWRKALSDGKDVSVRVKHDLSEAMDDMGEFAIISAWARRKGKKG